MGEGFGKILFTGVRMYLLDNVLRVYTMAMMNGTVSCYRRKLMSKHSLQMIPHHVFVISSRCIG